MTVHGVFDSDFERFAREQFCRGDRAAVQLLPQQYALNLSPHQAVRLAEVLVERAAVANEQTALKHRLDLRTPYRVLREEAAAVLAQLDDLAHQWGDEAVFRRCRDRLRAAVKGD